MRIRRAVIDAMIEHARQENPLECCGLLVGKGDEVIESRAARNARKSATAYLVDPRDHFEAIRQARARGLAVVGAYHSHPGSPAQPSVTDIREANDPEFIHVIVSLASAPPQVAAFRMDGDRAVALPLAIGE